MVSQFVTVSNASGIHARPASVLTKAATQCRSNIYIIANGKKIIAKSILNIMAAAIKSGTEIEVQCDGATEKEDLNTIVSLIESGLGE